MTVFSTHELLRENKRRIHDCCSYCVVRSALRLRYRSQLPSPSMRVDGRKCLEERSQRTVFISILRNPLKVISTSSSLPTTTARDLSSTP
ncbi:hypothetical protein EJ04DRAFT_286663 [Polyplosphaeria fusca]|uniref:Uncharacterized protein n=1 Tax=Polyplosphaeria fusca TaxID=682080 RepID=A0A9P4R5I2_9PLEO|nr:hypothetical protein EJ04DRAFT_286663 [Polyplosphaeria fusca]